MIRLRAKIKLYKGEGKRQTPFTTGYKPLFNFVKETKVSGQISLINQKEFNPGDEGIVELAFISEEFLGKDFTVGKSFNFYESEEPLGEGEIIEFL